jgi:hypothetical protein
MTSICLRLSAELSLPSSIIPKRRAHQVSSCPQKRSYPSKSVVEKYEASYQPKFICESVQASRKSVSKIWSFMAAQAERIRRHGRFEDAVLALAFVNANQASHNISAAYTSSFCASSQKRIFFKEKGRMIGVFEDRRAFRQPSSDVWRFFKLLLFQSP